MASLKTAGKAAGGAPGKAVDEFKISQGRNPSGAHFQPTFNMSSLGNALTKVAESSQYECPAGYDLVRESNGSGYLVCRNRNTGAEIAAQPRIPTSAGSSGGSSGGGASTGGGGGSTSGGSASSGNTGGPYLEQSADMFARSPEAMLADILERDYGDNNRGMGIYHMLAPYADAMNVLFLGQRGQDAEGGTKQEFIGWLEDAWNTMMTPGATFDVQSVIQNALNPEQNSPLAAYLAVGNPEQQARNFLNLLAGAYATGYHPLIADAMNYRLQYGANEFLGESARGEVDPFYDWIQQSMPFGYTPGTGRAY